MKKLTAVLISMSLAACATATDEEIRPMPYWAGYTTALDVIAKDPDMYGAISYMCGTLVVADTMEFVMGQRNTGLPAVVLQAYAHNPDEYNKGYCSAVGMKP